MRANRRLSVMITRPGDVSTTPAPRSAPSARVTTSRALPTASASC